MKKTLLAAALMAGFAGVAHAETSVTLYGILDGGIGYQKFKATEDYTSNGNGGSYEQKKTGMINGIQSGNRWGLKGSEDLGDGLRAVFQLESGFDLSTGKSAQGGRLFGRHATLGLAGDSWGQLDFGRQTNIASKYLPGVADPFGGGFDQANIGGAFTAANTTRYDNMVMYQTPNFSGFQFGVGYSFNTDGSQVAKINEVNNINDGLERNQRAVTTGLRYVNGPIGVALTYDQYKTAESRAVVNGPVSGGDTVKSWNIGGSYDFEVVKAYLAFGQTRDGLFAAQSYSGFGLGDVLDAYNNPSLDGLKVNSYLVGLSAPVGAGTVMGSWTMADPRSAPDVLANSNLSWEMKKQHTFSLGYSHPLSKRTNVYAIGSYAKNVYFLPDAKSTLIGVGLRHQF
ncbi:outer membrane porin protein [Alcaligenes faecalis subsp. faecalis NCIB 8687]|uniref:porin n=1 Tax=unclassified Alcaligenes TaxID=259357 RepID=UPI000269ECD0|nr:porin [Alcaligenes sp. NLF5-7]EJC64955.1 outer membrane porin protein [Alcaligenes faecalis subsp. faecalis NCIB 8687]UTM00602.1 porin [Alcaligenes sp. NLF5-7]